MQDNSYSVPQQISPNWRRWAIVGTIIVGVGIVAYIIISAIITQQSTGILELTASSNKASLEVQKNDEGTIQNIGTGTASVRLSPGVYRLTATDNDAQTLATATVSVQQTTSVHLALKTPFKASKLVGEAGQNVFQNSPSQVSFLRTITTGLGQFTFGKPSVDAYLPDITLLAQVYWLDLGHFYSQGNDGDWFYYNGTSQIPLVSVGSEGDVTNNDNQPLANSVTFNHQGQAAYVSVGKGIFVIDTAGGTPRQIGTLANATNAQASIAANGDVLVSTPLISVNDKATASQLYRAGKPTTLPTTLTGIANVTWSPDNSRISYTTNNGIYTYDFASQKVSQVLAGSPTNQLSVTWLSNSTLIFAQDGAIWRYQTDGSVSTKIATIEGVLNMARPFTVGADGQTVYFGTAPDSKNNGGAIYGFLPNQDTLAAAQLKTLQQNLQAAVGIQNFNNGALITNGLTADQVNGLRLAFYAYGQQTHQHITDIAVDDASIKDLQNDRKVDPPRLGFTVKLNNKDTFAATVDYPGFRDIRLYLQTVGTGQPVFDSQTITITSTDTN
ncbi:MAG TPA: hypothetical protein VH144_01030 [Candidatus Saccharimonadales bacterium]|jgi:hypothetical protein|nr:hypothetical protein [Candidatus Saccharimonadales bacterium]